MGGEGRGRGARQSEDNKEADEDFYIFWHKDKNINVRDPEASGPACSSLSSFILSPRAPFLPRLDLRKSYFCILLLSPRPPFPKQAAKGYEGAEAAGAALFALPKRLKNLEKKVVQEESLAALFSKQKGWPRGYEFGSHRLQRKFRQSDWDHAMMEWQRQDADGDLAF